MSERQEREYNRGEPYDHEFVQPPSSAADASVCSFCGHKQIEHTAPWRVGGSAEPVAPPDFRAEWEQGLRKIGTVSEINAFVERLLVALEEAEQERGSWHRAANAWERRAVEAEACERAALARALQGDAAPEVPWTQDRVAVLREIESRAAFYHGQPGADVDWLLAIARASLLKRWGASSSGSAPRRHYEIRAHEDLTDNPAAQFWREVALDHGAAIWAALDELGVPSPDYPAPVANAVAILRASRDTAGLGQVIGRPGSAPPNPGDQK